MTKYENYDEIAEFLKSNGHSMSEVMKIVAKLEQYEREMISDSVFDSLENGTFSLPKIIKEALDEPAATDEASSESPASDTDSSKS